MVNCRFQWILLLTLCFVELLSETKLWYSRSANIYLSHHELSLILVIKKYSVAVHQSSLQTLVFVSNIKVLLDCSGTVFMSYGWCQRFKKSFGYSVDITTPFAQCQWFKLFMRFAHLSISVDSVPCFVLCWISTQ